MIYKEMLRELAVLRGEGLEGGTYRCLCLFNERI